MVTDQFREAAEIEAETPITIGHLKGDFERAEKIIEELRTEVACPDCGCATVEDAEASECGCDSIVCQRERPLVTEYLSVVERLRVLERLAAYAVTCESRNSDDWMKGLQSHLQAVLKSQGDSGRVTYDGRELRCR